MLWNIWILRRRRRGWDVGLLWILWYFRGYRRGRYVWLLRNVRVLWRRWNWNVWL
jgi:hypothetical protein